MPLVARDSCAAHVFSLILLFCLQSNVGITTNIADSVTDFCCLSHFPAAPERLEREREPEADPRFIPENDSRPWGQSKRITTAIDPTIDAILLGTLNPFHDEL